MSCTTIGEHNANGLHYEKLPDNPDFLYVLLSPHNHQWRRNPTLGREWNPVGPNRRLNRLGMAVVSFTETGVTLHEGYAWDGSSGPAIDTCACMRASALHDAWCQAMAKHIYKNSYKNWRRGSAEYRSVCRADGMSWWRAWGRWTFMNVYGLKKALPS